MTYVKQRMGWRMSCDVGKATEGLGNESFDVGEVTERLKNERSPGSVSSVQMLKGE